VRGGRVGVEGERIRRLVEEVDVLWLGAWSSKLVEWSTSRWREKPRLDCRTCQNVKNQCSLHVMLAHLLVYPEKTQVKLSRIIRLLLKIIPPIHRIPISCEFFLLHCTYDGGGPPRRKVGISIAAGCFLSLERPTAAARAKPNATGSIGDSVSDAEPAALTRRTAPFGLPSVTEVVVFSLITGHVLRTVWATLSSVLSREHVINCCCMERLRMAEAESGSARECS
jgi:hypothetical protein